MNFYCFRSYILYLLSKLDWETAFRFSFIHLPRLSQEWQCFGECYLKNENPHLLIISFIIHQKLQAVLQNYECPYVHSIALGAKRGKNQIIDHLKKKPNWSTYIWYINFRNQYEILYTTKLFCLFNLVTLIFS